MRKRKLKIGMYRLILASAFISSFQLIAQDITQTVKGRVLDADTEIPLPGATVVIVGSDPLIGTTTDIDGYFKIERVTIGRYDLRITFMGFEPAFISEWVVGSGKEVVVNVNLKESAVVLGEVVVT
ncbi:MAG: carboxypeptidase-like regulatory domain-containing protein, partial [Bacteroidales bacterium]|nr:carboxypeptidase-like regulatory domain-containing protein [Bacteroidales bacterium]